MKNRDCFHKLALLGLILGMILAVTACSRGDRMPEAMPAPAATPAPAVPQEAEAPAEAPVPWAGAGRGTYDIDEPQAEDAPAPAADASPEIPAQQAPVTLGVDLMQRMIIRSADMGLNTLYYKDTIAGIEATVANRGGFIENSRQWMAYSNCADMMLWHAEYVIRVPVGLFDVTNRELKALGQVRHFSTASHDATHEFNDLGSRLQIRIAEETRVQHMLDEATELDDIISLEARLTSLRLVIDAYHRRREEIDHLATFSTIRLSVSQVVELPEIQEEYEDDEEEYNVIVAYGFGDRIGGAFSASVNFTAQALETAAVFLALIILPAGLLAAVGMVVFLIAKRINGGKWPLRWVRG